MRAYTDIPIWSGVDPGDWSDWKWQLQHCIFDGQTLEHVIPLTESERRVINDTRRAGKMKISPHVVSLMNPTDPNDAVRRSFVPSPDEFDSAQSSDLFSDVNADLTYSPTKGLVHRYPSKVLLFPTSYCGSYCRYCFRRVASNSEESALASSELQAAFKYIEEAPNVEEVILSGGDPLVLPDEELCYIVRRVCEIGHVRILRIHTRIPVTIPYRITCELAKGLNESKGRKVLFVVMHVASAPEMSEPMKVAVARLVDHGIPCFASCPLLRGVNDDEKCLRRLWTDLLTWRVKPYYLFHSDPVRGLRHFLVSLERGAGIMKNLYDRMSGLAMPLYCFNVPEGGGHVLLGPQSLVQQSPGVYTITNFEGKSYTYHEPSGI